MTDTENKVRIIIDDYHCAHVEQGARYLLPLLADFAWNFESTTHGVAPDRKPEFFCRLDFRNRILLSPGLIDFLATEMARIGIDFEVEDRREMSHVLAADENAVNSLSEADRQIAEAVIPNLRGQLHFRGHTGLVRSISAICRVFPQANILLFTATQRHARYLSRLLADTVGERVQLAHGKWEKCERIIISTYCYLRDAQSWQIVLFPDLEDTASSTSAWEKIQSIRSGPKRIYGFIGAHRNPTRRQSLAAQNLTGPILYRLSPKPATVCVHVCDARSWPYSAQLEGLERKRINIWHNEQRNADIAKIAAAAARGDVQKLWTAGLFLDEGDNFLRAGIRSGVAVVVESAEHAEELKKRLPNWAVNNCRSGEQTEHSDPQAPGIIATFAYAASAGLEAGLIIRADGDEGQMPIRNFPPPQRAGLPSVILIEFSNSADESLALSRRLDGYARAGWMIQGGRKLLRDPITHLMPPDVFELLKKVRPRVQ